MLDSKKNFLSTYYVSSFIFFARFPRIYKRKWNNVKLKIIKNI
jgi:hypothetical protein